MFDCGDVWGTEWTLAPSPPVSFVACGGNLPLLPLGDVEMRTAEKREGGREKLLIVCSIMVARAQRRPPPMRGKERFAFFSRRFGGDGG